MRTAWMTLCATVLLAGYARADISDTGHLLTGGRGVIQGTMTVQGQDANGFSIYSASGIYSGGCLTVQGGQVCGPVGSAGAGATGATGPTGATGATGIANASGTQNRISKFTTPTSLGDSLIFDDGSHVGIATTAPSSTMTVNGALSFPIGGLIRWPDGTATTSESRVNFASTTVSGSSSQSQFLLCQATATIVTHSTAALRIMFTGDVANTNSGPYNKLNVMLDGNYLTGYTKDKGISGVSEVYSAGFSYALSMSVLTPPVQPGTHNVCVSVCNNGGTTSFQQDVNTASALTVEEVR